MNNKGKLLYVIIFIFICSAPLFLMKWFGHQPVESTDSEVPIPNIKDEYGKFNKNIMREAGDYFEKKFAFRIELVDLNGKLYTKLFKTSSQPRVIFGKDGYLFYSDSIDSYIGSNNLSDYQINAASYNLKLAQQMASKAGADFVFTIAPNKNSLYGQFMPDRFGKKNKNSDAVRLEKALKKKGVNYYNLFDLFQNDKEIRYHKTDSHWNNYGAAMGQNALLTKLGKAHRDYTKLPYKVKNDFKGDLYAMLYPNSKGSDTQIYFDYKFKYKVSDGTDDVTLPIIETANPEAKGNVAVIRDSFGNVLLKFIAEEYNKGFFTKATPYAMQASIETKADDIIFELVERNLEALVRDAFELFTPVKLNIQNIKSIKSKATNCYSKDNMNLGIRFWGNLEPKLAKNADEIYFVIGGKDYSKVWQAFKTIRCNKRGELIDKDQDKNYEYGYALYINPKELPKSNSGVYVIYKINGKLLQTGKIKNYKY